MAEKNAMLDLIMLLGKNKKADLAYRYDPNTPVPSSGLESKQVPAYGPDDLHIDEFGKLVIKAATPKENILDYGDIAVSEEDLLKILGLK